MITNSGSTVPVFVTAKVTSPAGTVVASSEMAISVKVPVTWVPTQGSIGPLMASDAIGVMDAGAMDAGAKDITGAADMGAWGAIEDIDAGGHDAAGVADIAGGHGHCGSQRWALGRRAGGDRERQQCGRDDGELETGTDHADPPCEFEPRTPIRSPPVGRPWRGVRAL